MLATDEGLSETVTVEEQFKAMGIEGVPSFVVGGVVLFSGAAEANVMIEAFRPVCAGATPMRSSTLVKNCIRYRSI